MATFYALPGLNTWNYTAGWSATSGGPSIGDSPSTSDTAIFDANSGPSRTISLGGTQCAITTINTVGANPMTFVSGGSSGYFLIFGLCNFTGTVSIPKIILGGGTLSSTSGPILITGDLLAYDGYISIVSSDTVINGNFSPYSSSPSTLTIANGAKFTVGGSFGIGNSTINFGTSTLILLTSSCFITPNSNTCSLATIKFMATTAVTLTDSLVSGTQTWGQIWNATSSGGSLSIGTNSGVTIAAGTFRADGGSITKIQVGKTLSAANWNVNGLGNPLTFTSAVSGSVATILKTGGGLAEFGYAAIKDITASPTLTFTARNSVNNGNNTNINFSAVNNNFMSFM